MPSKLFSILTIILSSTSDGDAPGKTAFIVMNFGLIKGKKDDFNEIVPAIPKIIKNKIKIFTGIL